MTLISELLPAPFGPMTARISPRATDRSTALSAVTPPNASDTSRISSALVASTLAATTSRVAPVMEASVTDHETASRWAADKAKDAVPMVFFDPRGGARRKASSSGRRKGGGASLFKFAYKRDHVLAEIFDFFLEMQEAEHDQACACILEGKNAFRDLVRRTDQVRAEAVIVLNQILERGFGPVTLSLRRGFAGILHFVGEGVDRLGIGLADDLGKNGLGFGFAVARDRECVDADPYRMIVLRGLDLNIVGLFGDFVGCVAIGEIPIGDARRHVACRPRRAALEDLRQRRQRLRPHRVVVEMIEKAFEGERVVGPDAP